MIHYHLQFECKQEQLLSPTNVEARKRRSPEINWYLLKSNFRNSNRLNHTKFFDRSG